MSESQENRLRKSASRPADAGDTENLDGILNRLLNGTLIAMAILGLLAAAASILRAVDLGWRPIMTVHAALLLLLWSTVLARRHCPYGLRVALLLLVLWVAAATGLATFGIASGGAVMLLLAAMFATLLLGTASGVVMAVLCTMLMGVMGILVCQGHVPLEVDFNEYVRSPLAWTAIGTGTLLFTGITVTCFGLLRESLIANLGVVSARAKALERANASLQREIEERERVQQALRESEEKHRTLTEQSIEGIGIAKGDQVLYANRALLDIFGYDTLEAFLPVPLLRHVAPEYHDRILELRRQRAEGEQISSRFDYQIIRRDGQTRSLEATAVDVWLGGERCSYTTFRDLTERLEAEEALRRSQAMLSLVLNSVPQSIFWKDRDSVYLGCNEVFARAAGVDRPEEIVGKTDFDLPWLRAEAEAYRADDQEVMTNRQAKRHIEEPLQQADGTRLWIDTTKVPLTEPDGSVSGVLGVYDDITHLKEAREALRASEEKYRRIIEDQAEFIVRWRPDGIRTFVNDSYCRYYDISQEQAVGTSFFPLISEEHLEAVRRRVESLSPDSPVSSGEHRVVRPDGTEGWNHWTDRAIFDAQGSLIEYQSVGRDTTDYRRTEEALRENEARHRSLIDKMPIVCFTFDREGRFLSWNATAEQVYGYSAEEAVGASAFDLIVTEATQEATEDVIKRTFAGETILGTEWQDHNKEGHVGWRMGNTFPLLASDGTIDCGVNLNIDITERRTAEEALAMSEHRLELAHEAAGLGLFDWDIHSDQVVCNDRYFELFGLAPRDDTLSEEDWLAMVHPEDRPRALDEVKRALAGGTPYDTEYRVVWPDGEIHWVSSKAKVFRDSDDRPYRMIGALVDITERKEAEAETLRLRNYLMNIVNSMPSLLIGVDVEGRVNEWNAEAERTTGIGASQAQGQMLVDLLPQWSGALERVSQAIQDRRVLHDSKVTHHQQGQTHFSDITLYPLSANGVEGAVVRIDDITDRVRMEEMMIQSEKMLTVGGLAAGMAHEINNPLAGILQNIQVIRQRISPDLAKNREIAGKCGLTMEALLRYMRERELPEMMEAVIDSGRRAAKIVENMLSFSRKGDARLLPHDLADLIDKTVELASNDYDLKKKYDFRRIDIIRQYAPDVPMVPCESSKIQQVILNILKNGAQAMAEMDEPKEPPRFTLRLWCEAEMACLDIEDNGPGMDEETRRRVFEPFFTTKEVGVGTGLGLSVSYFIVSKDHGGTMAVESTPGEGTTFKIRLPQARSQGPRRVGE